MKPPPELPVPVEGVFAYLDAALKDTVKEALAQTDPGPTTCDYLHCETAERRVQDYISDTFRLMHWGSPVRKALDAFRLYHPDDMSHALVCAYRRHLRGEDPVEALAADYGLRDWGILSWMSLQEVRDASDGWLWNEMAPFHKDGDRFIHYSRPTSCGTLLVRGDRLVWDVEAIHMDISAVSPRRRAADDKFQELGGTRAFLAGEFDWPPEGWVNPVTDEEEEAVCGRKRGIVVSNNLL